MTGFEPGDESPASRLQRVFGIGSEAAERLIARLPAPVQRGVPRIRAEYFRRALLKIGAHVEVRSPEGLAVEAVPSVPPPAPRRVSDRPARGAGPVVPPVAAPPPAAASPEPPSIAAHASAPAPPSMSPAARAAAPTALAAPAPAVKPAAPVLREPRLFDDDEGVPLADSLRPEALALSLDLPGAPAAAPAPAPPALIGATADTLIDSSRRQPTPPAQAAPRAAALDHDTLADAIQLPTRPTLTEGLKPKEAPAQRAAVAAATLMQGKMTAPAGAAPPAAVSPPAAAPPPAAARPGEAPLAFGADARARGTSGSAFQPPALELGLDGADAMTKLPSSIWDAPPKQGDAPRPAGGSVDAKLELPSSPSPKLDLSGFPSGTIDDPLDLPSMAAPAKVGRPPLRESRPQPARERPSKEAEPKEGPRARAGKVGAARVSRKKEAAPEPERAPVPFWPSVARAFTLPFAGTGGAWLGLIVLWALAAALITAASTLVVALGVVVAVVAYTTLLALACDYFRACFWVAEEGGSALERTPSLAPARILHSYLKSGAHLTVFALAAGLLLIFVAIAGVSDGATPLELISEPQTWAFAAIPALLWPGAVAMTALHNRYEAIWQLPSALSLAMRAPAEYLAVVAIGALIFGAGVWLLLALASAAGISGVLLSAVLGPPMALSHGVQGALMGLLMRARPELFR